MSSGQITPKGVSGKAPGVLTTRRKASVECLEDITRAKPVYTRKALTVLSRLKTKEAKSEKCFVTVIDRNEQIHQLDHKLQGRRQIVTAVT